MQRMPQASKELSEEELVALVQRLQAHWMIVRDAPEALAARGGWSEASATSGSVDTPSLPVARACRKLLLLIGQMFRDFRRLIKTIFQIFSADFVFCLRGLLTGNCQEKLSGQSDPLISEAFNKKAVPHHTERRSSAKACAACLGRKGLTTATTLLGIRI